MSVLRTPGFSLRAVSRTVLASAHFFSRMSFFASAMALSTLPCAAFFSSASFFLASAAAWLLACAAFFDASKFSMEVWMPADCSSGWAMSPANSASISSGVPLTTNGAMTSLAGSLTLLFLNDTLAVSLSSAPLRTTMVMSAFSLSTPASVLKRSIVIFCIFWLLSIVVSKQMIIFVLQKCFS